jgi:hypothetical protein
MQRWLRSYHFSRRIPTIERALLCLILIFAQFRNINLLYANMDHLISRGLSLRETFSFWTLRSTTREDRLQKLKRPCNKCIPPRWWSRDWKANVKKIYQDEDWAMAEIEPSVPLLTVHVRYTMIVVHSVWRCGLINSEKGDGDENRKWLRAVELDVWL